LILELNSNCCWWWVLDDTHYKSDVGRNCITKGRKLGYVSRREIRGSN